jgi:hypothetical protein
LVSSDIELPKNAGENSTHYIPTTTNRFELLSKLTKDTDKEPRNYSRYKQRKFVHKETTFRGNYKADIEIAQHTCIKHDSAINGNCRNQQAYTKKSTHAIPFLVNGLTSMDVSTKNNYHEPKSSSEQNREHKIIIIGDSYARGAASNVKHNLNKNYRSSGFVRPRANID